jgi:hypothetical protein
MRTQTLMFGATRAVPSRSATPINTIATVVQAIGPATRRWRSAIPSARFQRPSPPPHPPLLLHFRETGCAEGQ